MNGRIYMILKDLRSQTWCPIVVITGMVVIFQSHDVLIATAKLLCFGVVMSAAIHATSRSRVWMDDNNESRRGLSSALTRGDDGARRLQHFESAENAAVKQVQIVDWDGYRRIDHDEVARGAMKGKPREKLVGVGRMLDVALPKGS